MPLFETISMSPFHAVLVEPWNAPPHRYFFAYRTTGDFRHIIGNGVVDEFATFSSPIFFGPKHLLGQIYNTGITLGHQRHPDMSLDQGWPPFCVGIDSDQKASFGWEERLLDAIKTSNAKSPVNESEYQLESRKIGEALVIATNAPLLPRQLQQLCQISMSPVTIAFSIGNRITRGSGKPLTIRVASATIFKQILHRFSAIQTDK